MNAFYVNLMKLLFIFSEWCTQSRAIFPALWWCTADTITKWLHPIAIGYLLIRRFVDNLCQIYSLHGSLHYCCYRYFYSVVIFLL